MMTASMVDSVVLCQTLPCLYHTTLLAGLLSTLQLRVATRLRDTWAGWDTTRGPSAIRRLYNIHRYSLVCNKEAHISSILPSWCGNQDSTPISN